MYQLPKCPYLYFSQALDFNLSILKENEVEYNCDTNLQSWTKCLRQTQISCEIARYGKKIFILKDVLC